MTKDTAPTLPDQAGEPIAWTADQLYDAIEEVLLHHRVSNMEGDDGEAYPLVDQLTTPGADSVESGQFEIRLICDAIYNEVLTVAAPTAQTTGGVPAGCVVIEEADFVPHVHPEYGMGRFVTEDCVYKMDAAPPANAPAASIPGDIYQIQGHISKTWMDVTKEAYESTPFERRIVRGAHDGDKWWDAYEAEHKRVERLEGILIRELGLAKAQAFLATRDTPSVMRRSVDAWDKYWSGGRAESDAVEFVKAISAQRALLSARGE